MLDTGGWLHALAGIEPYATALGQARPAVVPGLVLAEVDWHLRHHRSDMHRLLSEIAAGAYVYEPATAADIARAKEIDRKFHDLELGLVDASIAALAERLDVYDLLTTDRDFVAVRMGRGWRKAMALAVPLTGRRS